MVPIQTSRSLNKERLSSTKAFLFLIGIVSLILLVKNFLPPVQHLFFKQFHLTQKSFLKWAALQYVPSMYNFSNELWYSYEPIGSHEIKTLPKATVFHRWYNHYPLRFVTFGLYRDEFFKEPKEKFITVRSHMRSESLTTHYLLSLQNNKVALIPVKKEHRP